MQKNLNIKKIIFKVVQMRFLAMHINNQKFVFIYVKYMKYIYIYKYKIYIYKNICMVVNSLNIFTEHDLYLIS